VLRSVARAGSTKDLAAILDTASKVLPLVVAVSGRVGSDTPLICQQSGMRGVIVEETVSIGSISTVSFSFSFVASIS
jgi:E3 ubiquitin-protein ligase MUL1